MAGKADLVNSIASTGEFPWQLSAATGEWPWQGAAGDASTDGTDDTLTPGGSLNLLPLGG